MVAGLGNVGRAATRPGAIGVGGRVVVIAVGYLVGGFVGAVVATAGVVALELEPPGAVARAAAASLALAGLATVFEQWPTAEVNSAFATDRPIAAGLARAAAILAFVAVVVGARAERSPAHPSRARTGWPAVSITRARVTGAAPFAAVGLIAYLVRAIAAPIGMPPGYAEIVDRLRAGHGFTTAAHPPLAPVLAAFAPFGPTLLAGLATGLTTAVVAVLGWRVGGRRAALAAGALAALLPSVWGQQLPEALAALGVSSALAWAWPDRLTPMRAVLAGLALVAATLARPETVLVAPVVVAWVVVAPPRRGRADRRARLRLVAILTVTFAVGYAPWGTWIRREHGTRLPSTNLGTTLAGANGPRTQRGAAIGAWDAGGVRGVAVRAGGEAARDRAYRSLAWDRIEGGRVVPVVAARFLRGWELWSPRNAARVRVDRGLPFPGRTVGALAEMAVSVLALATLVRRRRDWRSLLPFVVLPALFSLESVLLFGDRALRAWVAPVVVLLAVIGMTNRPGSQPAAPSVDTAEPGA